MATCTITGHLKLPNGDAAPYAKLRLVRASLTGTVILKDPEDKTADVAGVVTFTATQGATIYVYCNAAGLDTNGPRGVALAVPASSTANLEDLVSVTTDQVGTITASRAAVSNSVGTIVASTTTAAQILALASLTASRALVSDSSGSIVHATTTATQLNSLATLTAGSVPYLSATGVFAPTSGPGALIDSMGQPTYPNFTVKQTTASTLEDMIIVKNAAGTAVWALDILANSNISFLDYVNNKNVITLAAGATYTYLQLLSTAGINFAGTGTVGATSMGLSRVSTTALAVTGGATIAAGGAYRDLGLRNLLVNGTSSGVVTIAGAAAAGTWTLTLPTDGGTVNYFLQTNGSGTTTWAAAAGASAALDNLASVNINTSLLAQTGVDLGSTTKPFRDLYLFGSGTYGTTYIKQTGTPTSTRTITWPDATGIPAISASALTSGRLPSVTTGGLLVDSANATLDTSGNLFVVKASIGSASLTTATFNVTPASSSTIGQIIKLAASQSADALQVQNSSGTVVAYISAGTGIISTVGDGASSGRYGEFRLGNAYTRVASGDSGGGWGGGYNFDWNNAAPRHNSTGALAGFGWVAGSGFVLYTNSSQAAGTSVASATRWQVGLTGLFGVWNGAVFGWSSTADAGGTVDIGLARNAAGVLEINNGTAGTYRDLILRSSTYTYLDAVTNALTTLVTYQHNSSGTPANSFGSRVLFNLHSTTTTNQNAGSVDVYWSDATHATRTSVVALCAVNSAAALAEVFKVTGAGLMTPLDGGHFALGTSTGTKFGTATSQKLAFFNSTPIIQPAGSAQVAMTDSTTGSVTTTLSDVGGAYSQSAINTNFASLNNLVGGLRTALVNLGLIKGAA